MSENKQVILIVDDEIEICNLFKDFFDFMGYESKFETDGEKVLNNLENMEYDLMFLDLKLGAISGLEILKISKQIHPLSEVIVVTGYGSRETVLKTFQYGALSYIQKPFSFLDIREKTEEALSIKRFNVKTDKLNKLISEKDEALFGHLEKIINLDRLSKFLNISIDVEVLSDAILRGIANLLPGMYFSFFSYYESMSEMVIYSEVPFGPNCSKLLQAEIIKTFEMKSNHRIGELYTLRTDMTTEQNGDADVESLDDFSTVYVPILIENSVSGLIGVTAMSGTLNEETKDILHIISNRISPVYVNATLHRNTMLLALTDGLTSLLNHRAFQDRLSQEFDRFKRYGSCLSLIIADLDDLKTYNDIYGHPAGDEILRKIGEIFRETSRETDVLARYGGDEFVVLLPETTSEKAMNMAKRIKEKIKNYDFHIQDDHFNCSMSLGIATVPCDGIEKPLDLFEQADNALYKAKRTGKNKICVA